MMALRELLPNDQLSAAECVLLVGELTLDSRVVTAGDTFVAVAGESTDGRQFIDQALDQGASCVLAQAEGLVTSDDPRVVAVENLKLRLGELAARFYNSSDALPLLAGVTGTNGKTSVAWFLRQALNELGKKCALIGTLGADFNGSSQATADRTTPDVLRMHRLLAGFKAAGADACVMEVSSHALVQERIQAVPIKLAIFTNLSRDHLDYHGSMENYFSAKARLFLRPEVSIAVVNADDDAGQRLIAMLSPQLTLVTFGWEQSATVRVVEFVPTESGAKVVVDVAGEPLTLLLPLFGAFNVSNVLAVVASLHGLGYKSRAIAAALATISAVPGRMQSVATTDVGPTVLVDYAHTPDGLEKALRAARAHFAGKLWCIVGCGGNRDTGKRPMMAALAERLADGVMLTSDNPRYENPLDIIEQMMTGLSQPKRVLQQPDRALAIATVIDGAADDDVVLICGKGHEGYQEVAGEKRPMDDRQLAQQALKQRQAKLTSGGAGCA